MSLKIVVLLCTTLSLPSPGEGEGCGLTLGTVNFAAKGDARQRTSPWMVALGLYEGEQFLVECSGSVITPTTLSTAAHCLHTPGLELVARAGESNLRYRGGQEAKNQNRCNFGVSILGWDGSWENIL